MFTARSKQKDRWKYSVYAMLTLFPSGSSADFFIYNPETIGTGKRYLKRSLANQGVENPEDLKMRLEWQISQGVRSNFAEMYQELCLLPADKRARRIEAEEDPDVRQKLTVVNYYLWRMPPDGVGAYDYSSIVFKCLAGEKLGWLTAEEAQMYAKQSVSLAQEHFSNWHDYCFSFTVGLQFISPNLEEYDYVKSGAERIRRLLSFKRSPLNNKLFEA